MMKRIKYKHLKLTQAIQPINFQNKALRVAKKKITNVDKISSYVARDITILDLSSNYISQLSEFNQFMNITELNLSNNIICDGRQLLKLYSLFKLRTVFICGNPFLQDPLDQDVLEFIMQKQTDIQILSGQALKNIKQIETGELKLIFLQNYLKKIRCHQELLSKVQKAPIIETQQKQQSQQQQQYKKCPTSMLNKIIPQFYTALQSANICHRIRKQTVQMKRQHKHNPQVTFQQVIEMKKKNQQKMVQNMIKDILVMVEDLNHNAEPMSYSFDNNKFDYQLKNKFQSSFKRKWFKASPDSRRNQIYRSRISSQSPPVSNQKSIRLPQSLQTTQKLHHASNQSLIKPQIVNYLKNSRKKQLSQLKHGYTIGLSQKKNFAKTQQLRNITEISESFSSPKYISVISPKSVRGNSQFKKQSKTILKQNNRSQQCNHSMSNSNIELHLQNFQTYYYRNLTKNNPIYQLLYSPIASLSSQEKTILLETLSKSHKQISIQLLKYKKTTQQLRQDLKRLSDERQLQAQNLIAYWKESRQFASVKTGQLELKNTENQRMAQLLENSHTKLKILQLQSKQKDAIIKANQNDYKRLQQACLATTKKNMIYQLYEQYQEAIQTKKSNRIKKQYYGVLIRKAIGLSKLKKIQKSIKQKQQQRIKQLVLSGFKRYKLVNDYILIKKKQKAQRLIKVYFKEWAILSHLQKKCSLLLKIRSKAMISEMRHLSNINIASKKNLLMAVQKAIKHYRLKITHKIFNTIKIQMNKSKTKYQRVDVYIQKKIKIKYLYRLSGITQEKNDNIKKVKQNRIMYYKNYGVQQLQTRFNKFKDLQTKKTIIMAFLIRRRIRVYKINHSLLTKDMQKRSKKLQRSIFSIKIKSLYSYLKREYQLKIMNKQKQIGLISLQQQFVKSVSKVSKISQQLPFIQSLILLNENIVYLQCILTKRRIQQFYNNVRQNYQKQNLLNNKKQKLIVFLEYGLKSSARQFINVLRIKTTQTRHKIRQELIAEQNAKRQHQWISKLSVEDSNVQKLIQQLSQLHKQINMLKVNSLECGQQIEQLKAILLHKDKIIASYQQQAFSKFNDQQIHNEKYSRLLQLYGEAIDALDKKQKDCLWLIDIIQKQQRHKNMDNIVSAGNIVEKGNNYMSERVIHQQSQAVIESQNRTIYQSPERKQSNKFRYCSGSTRKKYAKNNLHYKRQ